MRPEIKPLFRHPTLDYSITAQEVQMLRRLLQDVQLMLSEFSPDPEIGHLGYQSAVVRKWRVEELLIRCKNHYINTIDAPIGKP